MLEKKYNRSIRICLSFLCLFFTALFISIVLEPTVTAQQDAWKVTLEEGKTATSNIKINNRCSQPHHFRLEENMKYLSFNEPTDSILVAPGASKPVGVTFDATGLKPDVYEDDILIICLDCKKEKTCKQDKDKHPVQLTVKPKPVADGSKDMNGDKCQNKMGQETDEYIKAQKIQIKNSSSEFYANKDEQVYVVSSNESFMVSGNTPVKNTIAVINSKDKSGKSVFYVTEQEIKPDAITYSVKKDSVVLKSVDVEVSYRKNKPQTCEELPALNAKAENDARARANKTCLPQFWSYAFCAQPGNPNSIQWALIYVEPWTIHCSPFRNFGRRLYLQDRNITWSTSSLVNESIDSAIEKQVSLFRTSF